MSNQGDGAHQSEYRLEMEDFIASKQVITVEPSGLSLCQRGRRKAQYDSTIQVPYSDHSSYTELVEFVKHLKPKKLVPIVRRPLPNQIDTTNLNELSKFLNTTSAPINCLDRFRLLMQSASSVRRSARLNNYNLSDDSESNPGNAASTTRTSTPVVNQRFIAIRRNVKSNSNLKRHIEYESPQKEESQSQTTRTRSRSMSPEKQTITIDENQNKESDELENLKRKSPSVRVINNSTQQSHRLFNVSPTIVTSSTPIRNLRSAKSSLAPITEESQSSQQTQSSSSQSEKKDEEKEDDSQKEMSTSPSKSQAKQPENVLTPKQLNILEAMTPKKQTEPVVEEKKPETPKRSNLMEVTATIEIVEVTQEKRIQTPKATPKQTLIKTVVAKPVEKKQPINENAKENQQLYNYVIETAKELGYETNKEKLVDKTMNWLLDSFYW